MSLGMTEILLVLFVVLILFGGKKIPELAKGLGRAQREYKKARDEIERESKELMSSLEEHAEASSKSEEAGTKKRRPARRPARKTPAA
ncbi:MAG: twin-arginine translocase TatA/TatE family subunit [Burkholderiaceae bacterium]|jgi:sec-independent protein translocase protein TatA|nr:twin-arginine translocase TatA/TatE family subunit [Burkholderiaceae bacterium]